MKKSISKSILYNKPEYKGRKDNLQLLRIISCKDYCKVDLGYYATDYYIKGGWIRISKDTFLRATKTKQKYNFIKAENIAVAPEQHDFKTTKDWLYFSVYFEPLVENTRVIDFIEAEPGDATDFNFFNIQLNPKLAIEVF